MLYGEEWRDGFELWISEMQKQAVVAFVFIDLFNMS